MHIKYEVEMCIRDSLYTDEDLAESFDKIETVDYHSTMEINGIKFTAFHAGHVLGAAMFQVEIAGIRVLFTGDYSREIDRHLNSAEVPPQSSDVIIVESTFGTATHEPRQNRERKLTQLVHSVVGKGGRVLLPVFALGRAQEIMLILDEYWQNHKEELGNGQVPIFYASNLARKCMSVFQTYVNMMNDDIRKKFRDSQTNPFIFKNISYLKNLDDFEDFGPSVMIASPGMLQNGLSRDVLEKWCPDEKNLVLVTGYSVEGTMAKYLLLEPDSIPSINNPEQTIPRRCQVDEITFAAHVDFRENLEFIELIGASNIILVHGESNPMGRLKSALLSNFSSLKGTENEVHVYNPRNCVNVDLKFKDVKVAKALGNIVEELDDFVKREEEDEKKDFGNKITSDGLPEESERVVSGILVSDEKNFDLSLVSLSDLREHYQQLSTTVLTERQTVRVDCKNELVYWHLCQMFGDIDVYIDEENVSLKNVKPDFKTRKVKKGELELKIMGDVILNIVDNIATLQWTQNIISDSVADSVMAILLSVESAPASVKMTSHSCSHGHDDHITKIKKISRLFKEQFGDTFKLLLDNEDTKDEIKGAIDMGKTSAVINFSKMKVEECNSNPLKGRIESILSIGSDLVAPLC